MISKQEAVKLEEYSKAASLRDEIRDVENADPILQLESQLKSAIRAQDFQVTLEGDQLFMNALALNSCHQFGDRPLPSTVLYIITELRLIWPLPGGCQMSRRAENPTAREEAKATPHTPTSYPIRYSDKWGPCPSKEVGSHINFVL